MKYLTLISGLLICSCSAFSQGPPPLPPSGPPPLPVQAPKVDWFIGVNGEKQGPFDTPVIASKIKDGIVTKKTLVWSTGMAEWSAAGEVAQLTSHFLPAPTPPGSADSPGGSSGTSFEKGMSKGVPTPGLTAPEAVDESPAGIEGKQAGESRVINGIEMVWCPPTGDAGFQMGEEPALFHPVVLSKGFWIAKTETTQKQFTDIIGFHWSIHGDGDNFPMDFAGDSDDLLEVAMIYCEELNKKSPLPSGWKWTLPTEAQWEYACRAGSSAQFAGTGNPDDMGWYGDEQNSRSTHPVATKKPNAWGIYDMHGNVSELCTDWSETKYTPGQISTDPMGPERGETRKLRGGTVNTTPLGSGSRYSGYPIGFRPVISNGTIIKGMKPLNKTEMLSEGLFQSKLAKAGKAFEPQLRQLIPNLDNLSDPSEIPIEVIQKLEAIAKSKIAENDLTGSMILGFLMEMSPDQQRMRQWAGMLLNDSAISKDLKKVISKITENYDAIQEQKLLNQ